MIGQILNNRYTLEAELGRGGMGVVYRARDISLKRAVAVKVLPPEFTMDEQFLRRFKNEVLNVARLDHPNIVQVYDVGQDGNTHYYVMQLVEGSDLHVEVLRRGRFSLEEAVGIVAQVASALDYAHEQGIVHRDIKPDNILLDRKGQARVVDFGIAKSVEGTRMTGGMIGTPEYMSPEQARGEALDGRADQYALAIVVYEMLTGTTPFRGTDTQPWALVNMHISVAPPDPRQYQQDLPANVVQALSYGLAKNPGERFNTCTDFSGYLSSGANVTTPPVSYAAPPPAASNPPYYAAPPPAIARQQSPVLAIALSVVLTAMVAGGIALVVMSNNKKPVTPMVTETSIAPAVARPVAPTPAAPVTPVVATTGSRWPWTATRAITPGDLYGLNKSDLEIMRNEIYARHGWIFKRADLQKYFSAQSWYRPGSEGDNDSIYGILNPVEKLNAENLLSYEKSLGDE